MLNVINLSNIQIRPYLVCQVNRFDPGHRVIHQGQEILDRLSRPWVPEHQLEVVPVDRGRRLYHLYQDVLHIITSYDEFHVL